MSYWTRPEDVQAQWAELLPEFTARAGRHAGCQITLGVHVRNGNVLGLAEAKAERLEPNGREHGKARPWWSVIRRIQSVGNGMDGDAVILVKVVLNAQAQPVCWTAPETLRLEPKKHR